MIERSPENVDPCSQHIDRCPHLNGICSSYHVADIGCRQRAYSIMQIVPERCCITNLSPKEGVCNHRKNQAQPKGKRQERQECLHCSTPGSLLRIAWKCHKKERQCKEYECVENETERRRASISGNPGDDAVYKAKRHRVGNQEEDEGRV